MGTVECSGPVSIEGRWGGHMIIYLYLFFFIERWPGRLTAAWIWEENGDSGPWKKPGCFTVFPHTHHTWKVWPGPSKTGGRLQVA